MKNKAIRFSVLYSEIHLNYPKIIKLSKDRLKKLEELIETEQMEIKRDKETKTHIIASSIALFLFATYPYLIATAYSFISIWYISLSQAFTNQTFFKNHPEILISIFFVLLCVPFYTIVMPRKTLMDRLGFKFLTRTQSQSKPRELYVNTKKPMYILHTVFLNYLVIFIPIVYLHTLITIPRIILEVISKIWLMTPMIFIAAAPTFIVLFLSVLLLPKKDPSPTTCSLIYELSYLLKTLEDNKEDIEIDEKKKVKVVDSIILVSNLIRNLYIEGRFKSSEWATKEMNLAADSFAFLAKEVYFPKRNSIKVIKDKLVNYLNIFLSGNYHELPREKESSAVLHFNDNNKSSVWRKILLIIFLAVYLAAPILAILVVILVFKFEIPSVIQPLLSLLYIIWTILGFISFSDYLTPATKDFITEILKNTISRK